MREVTTFQARVYDAVSRIPRGKVSTYGAIARSIGCGCSRAVGQALRRNPFAPKVPCHRVIASSLKIGGFSGHAGGPEIQRKLELLNKEGVTFDQDGRLEDLGRLI